MKKWYFFLFFSCLQVTLYARDNNTSLTTSENWITIFIHGTVGDSLCLKRIAALFRDNIAHTPYAQDTLKTRSNPSWCQNHAAQGLGLQKIDLHAPIVSAAQLFAHLYDQMQQRCFPHQKTIDYYTFGWSGIINRDERYHAAEQLYTELATLLTSLRVNYPDLKTRLVLYSHAGNIGLNLAPVHKKSKNPIKNFKINELILLGTPIQRETDCFVLDPIFEKPYSIYSRSDCVQKMDCFSTIRIFSGRRFKDSSRCIIGNHVQQIQLKMTIAADKDLKQCATLHPKKRICRSPGHIELWHFAQLCYDDCNQTYEPCYSSRLYRPFFPLEPLPLAVFIPNIIHAAQNHMPHAHIALDFQPDTGKAVLRKMYTNEKETVDFVAPTTLHDLQQQSLPYLKKHTLRNCRVKSGCSVCRAS